MWCWSIDVAIKFDEKCVLKLCMYATPLGTSGHNSEKYLATISHVTSEKGLVNDLY